MRIALIRPNIGRLEHSLFVDEARMEPLELGVLGGLTPPHIEMVLYDDRIEKIPYDEPVDLAAITVQTFTARRAYEIATEYRKRGVKVILGGMHVSLIPQESARFADSVLIGDAEPLWRSVVADAEKGLLKRRYISRVGIPQGRCCPRRELYAGKRYLPLALLQFGRGCRNGCAYCATSAFSQGRHFSRAIDQVMAEIETIRARFLFFVDDNIVCDIPATKDLFRELAGARVKWVSQASINMTRDSELMTLMADSGCLGHVVGFESLDSRNLESVSKKINYPGVAGGYRQELEILRDFGLQTWAAFTLGYDFDTPSSISQLLDFAVQRKFAFAAFNVLMPYPGTPFYRSLAAEKRLLFDGAWWLHPEYRFNHAAFLPRLMSAQELTDAGFRCRSVFNSPVSIVKRAFDLKTNMRSLLRFGIYALYNPLFRRETFKKQGMRLGMKSEV